MINLPAENPKGAIRTRAHRDVAISNFVAYRMTRHSAGNGAGHQQGLSLVELMVALLISTLLLIGLLQIFAGSKQTYIANEGLSRLQENARFAMDFLARDIRMAGNIGCRGMLPPNSSAAAAKGGQFQVVNYLVNQTSTPPDRSPFDLDWGALVGFEANGTAPGDTYALPSMYPPSLSSAYTPAPNASLVGNAATGSDIIVLRMMDGDGAIPLVPDPSSPPGSPSYETPDNLFVSSQANVQPNQVLVVSDCEKMSVFQVTGITTSGGVITITHDIGSATGSPGDPGGNICKSWGNGCAGDADKRPYRIGSQVSQLETIAYFIAPGAGANGGPSLYRRTWNNSGLSTLELVEGIENMQILYGIGAPVNNLFTTTQYVPASGVSNWSQVVSVRIALLVSGHVSATASGQTTIRDTATYDVNGVVVSHVPDTRERRVFVTTFDLRNQQHMNQ